ncbi:MAG: rane protein [Firmicutes bacterium]|nr:rane protein [Bacillota bacterium]
MFIYFYKCLVSFLLPPGIIIIALAVINVSMWRQRVWGRSLLSGCIVVMLVMSSPYVADGLIRPLEYQYQPPIEPAGDVIVMLGGGAVFGSPDIGGYGNLTGSAANRMMTVARLEKKLGVPVILSGGQVYKDTGQEAIIGKRILMELGIAEDRIITEDKSLNTAENAVNVQKIIAENNYKQPILVTSAFHMPRSVLNFEKCGQAVQPYPADYFTGPQSRLYVNKIVPSAEAFRVSYIALHEYLGIIATKMI